ncbi:MAG: hypothetical protein K0R38_5224 [Polyangiaceae bacterium]|jgi:hypothetical protein|nr:hypothetical protein [Polyangiaceae bacterium]
MDGSILAHTRTLADELARGFHDDPAAELEMWAATAQQREAMVVRLYDSAAIEERLPKRAGEPDVLAVVRKSIGGIWAQERTHTTLVDALRTLDETRLTAAQSVFGAIEGRVAHRATTNGWTGIIAASLIGVVRAAGLAPEFTQAFRSLNPREFFRFSHELETTAQEGYERILELLATLRQTEDAGLSPSSALTFGITGSYEFAKTLAEERFHAAVFQQLDAWLRPDGVTFVGIPAHEAVVALRTLAFEHLSLGGPHLDPVLPNRPWTKSVQEVTLVSHGGLGELFEEFGLGLPACQQSSVSSTG